MKICNSIILLILIFAVNTRAEDWPIFRGLDKNGISTATDWKIPANGEAPVLWKAQVGLGYSAATVQNGRVFLTGHIDGEGIDKVFCFDETTGEQLWVFQYEQPKGDLYFQGGTTASVTADGDRIYHVAREGELFCLDPKDGKVIWKTHLQKDHQYSKPTWGFSGAPLPHGDVLYLTAGKAGIAFEKATGKLIWKSANEEAGYSTPYLFEKDGKELLVFTNKRQYVCTEAANGKLVWEYKWMTRYGVNAADPIITDDKVFISSGYGKGAVLLDWKSRESEPTRVWQSRDMKTQMNACILIDGYLYGIDGNERQDGTGLKCLEMATGKTLWRDESIGHGTVSVANNHLIVLSENGELQIAPVDPKVYQPVFKQKLLQPRIWTVPVLANGQLYCRNASGDVVVLSLK